FVVCDTVCDDIYSVSLHDALPILLHRVVDVWIAGPCQQKKPRAGGVTGNVSPGQGLEQDGGPSVLIVARRGTSVREEVLIMTRRHYHQKARGETATSPRRDAYAPSQARRQ